MRFLHVADLHIGRRLSGFSLEQEQRYALEQILLMAREQADAVLIAGDLYDKSQPSGAAVEMVSWFLTELSRLAKPVFLISGNHDSPQQVAYCAGLLSGAQVHVAGAFEGHVPCHVLTDEHGPVHVHLLPYLRPVQVKQALPQQDITTYDDAVRAVLSGMQLDPQARHVLVMHQFLAGGTRSDSEMVPLGGVDAVDPHLFDAFDYVALGHLHSPQRMAGGKMCYSGSPYKYSLSEEHQRKAALLVTLGQKGQLQVDALPLQLLRDVRSVRGPLQQLLLAQRSDDYVYAQLTDPIMPLDPGGALLSIYPNLVGYRMAELQGGTGEFTGTTLDESKSPLEHFVDFYVAQNGSEPQPEHMAIMRRIIAEAQEDAHETA